MASYIGRRKFLATLGGVAAWPLAARAQQRAVPVIGVLIPFAESDADSQTHVKVFQQTLQLLGWTEGRNIRIEYRWTAGGFDRIRELAKELIQLPPDVVVGQATPSVRALQQETSSIPIVFVQVTDPVRAGFVASMARPGSNITGLSMYEPAMGSKWIELLKQIAPGMKRIALLFNPETAPGGGSFFLRSIEAVTSSMAVQRISILAHDAAEIERGIDQFTRGVNEGLFVMPDVTMQSHRELIISLTHRHRIPAIYPLRTYVTSGGLMSYGIAYIHQFRQAAEYVDRILRGTKPSELPVQGPVKFDLVINLKTAKALGLDVPPTLLALADEVIE
jgi:putative ABC transport system substrate-binding protein